MGRRSDVGCVLAISATTLVGSLQRARGQEALRSALQSDEAARVREQALIRPRDDAHRIGPLMFNAGVSYELEASDNIQYENSDRQEDLIQRPAMSFDVVYEISEQSRLDLAVGVGYEDYIDNSDFDRFFISPGSEVALDIKVGGNGVITVFDRFDYSQEVASEGALSGVAQFPRFQNTVGIRSVWRSGRWTWQAGYSHLNVIVTEEDEGTGQSNFDYLERADEQFFGRAAHVFEFPVQTGLEASGNLSDYTQETQRDRETVSVGPFAIWKVADALEVSARGGLAYTSFQGTNSSAGDGDLNSYYAGLEVNHRLTEFFRYSLGATHDIQAGISLGTDYIETTRLEFAMDWKLMRHLNFRAQVFAEDSKETSLDSVSGLGSEEFQRVGANVNLAYDLTRHIALLFRYAFLVKDSEIESRSYTENRITVGASYRY